MNNAKNFSGVNSVPTSGATFDVAIGTCRQLTLWQEETPAQNTAEREATEKARAPICPDTSLPWSDDFALNGWSARMFLHQLLSISQPVWKHSDTERLLSESTVPHLRANLGSEISLSDVIRSPAGNSQEPSFRTAKMVQGLIRRALARGRSLRLLLRTERDTTPVIVTFGTNAMDYASWSLKSASALPDSLKDGLLDFLWRHAPKCAVTH